METSSLIYICLSACLIISTQAQFPYDQLGMSPDGVPSGPVDMAKPSFDDMKNFGTSNSGDAMENIFEQNTKMIPSGMRDFLVEGDIVVDYNVTEEGINKNSNRTRRNAIRNRNQRWPNGVVPFVIDNRFDSDSRQRIFTAMGRYHARTCIRFVQRTNQRDYIYIFPGSGCFSLVGRVGGQQQVSLGNGCLNNLGTIVHEFMHAVGFQHEQTRADRDNFVYIYRQNIIRGLEYNFDRYNLNFIDHLGTRYDYYSVMHYHMTAFTANGQPTIVARDQSVRLLYRSDFSSNDVRKINILYECDGTTTTPTTGNNCRDRNQQCSYWARIGECQRNPQWMLVNCAVSCRQCQPSAPTAPPATEECVDTNDYCPTWAGNGECQANPSWMLPNCPLSCQQCGVKATDTCTDKQTECVDWGRLGECDSNPTYMMANCPRTCGQCGAAIMNTCVNYDDNCENWAESGQCTENQNYMNYQCRKACNLCNITSLEELAPQVQCVDTNANCPIFRDMGMCEDDPSYMNYFCPETCGKCPGQLGEGNGGGNGAIGRWTLGEWLAVILASLLFSRWIV